jgi:uncharacterized protein (TIGR02217 family)
MSFHEVQFPTDISYGSSGGPEFHTTIAELGSGFEQRNVDWAQARAKYNVAWGVKSDTQLDALLHFFNARKGKAYGFRFKDWTDFKVTDCEIGVGDDSEDEFQLIKTYSSGGETYNRNIFKPVSGTVVIYLDDIDTEGSGWAVDTTTGVIDFVTPPGPGVRVDADCEFDVPCRFDVDHLPLSLDEFNINSSLDIRLIELRIQGTL